MSDALARYLKTIPKVYRPSTNRVILALLTAIAKENDNVATQIQNAKDQLFVRTATGQNLSKLANSLGVAKPETLGLTDEDFQELIPNLSLKPKQIKRSFYDTADVFWGPLFSRANLTTSNVSTFDVNVGEVFRVRLDSGEIQEAIVRSADVVVPGAMTAEEMIAFLNDRLDGATASIITDIQTGDKSVNLRTDTPGSVGKLEILSDSTILGVTKLGFEEGITTILSLDQRVSIYNINPNELLIEIPAIIPALRRTLKGSHHFHTDETLETPKGTAQGIWQGSFFFNPGGEAGAFTITSQRATLQQALIKGEVYPSISVDDTSGFANPSGNLIFDFGQNGQEQPVKYRAVPNSNTILLDPAYVFQNDHAIGSVVNVISQTQPYSPRRTGQDLAIYLTSPSGARAIVQEIIESLKAAGIIIQFRILAPNYKYLCDNPYITDDDAPSS